MVVADAPRRIPVRDLLVSALAAPFFVLGFTVATVVTVVTWCVGAVMLGVESARERWKRAG